MSRLNIHPTPNTVIIVWFQKFLIILICFRRLSTKHNFRFIPLCIGIPTQGERWHKLSVWLMETSSSSNSSSSSRMNFNYQLPWRHDICHFYTDYFQLNILHQKRQFHFQHFLNLLKNLISMRNKQRIAVNSDGLGLDLSKGRAHLKIIVNMVVRVKRLWILDFFSEGCFPFSYFKVWTRFSYRFVASPLYRNMLKTYGGSVKDLDAAITTS